jgi:hypothetical protein
MLRKYEIATRETDLMLAIQVEWGLPRGWAGIGASTAEAVVCEIGDDVDLE